MAPVSRCGGWTITLESRCKDETVPEISNSLVSKARPSRLRPHRHRGVDAGDGLIRRPGRTANDPKKQALVISVAYNLLKLYDPDKVAIEVVAFGPGIDLLFPDNANRKLVESLVAQGVRFDICLNTVDTIERETGKRPEFIAAATPVQVGVGQILSLTENGYTLVRP
jgi:intracellular sulfur oxidation DsrE/DsrF family protein